jgi:acetyltransferase-like isoleucine patch superfamily enzyme
MGSVQMNVIWPILNFLHIPRILRRILDEECVRAAQRQVDCAANARFGPTARVINQTGRRNCIRLGAGALVDGELLVHDYGGQIEIGENTYVGMGSRVWSGESVKIGNDVFIAHNVNISDTNSHQMNAGERHDHYVNHIIHGKPFQKGTVETAPVVIGNHAWINFNVGILKGVIIGEGAIVGACSLVTKNVPPYTFVAGNPLREIRKLAPLDGVSNVIENFR